MQHQSCTRAAQWMTRPEDSTGAELLCFTHNNMLRRDKEIACIRRKTLLQSISPQSRVLPEISKSHPCLVPLCSCHKEILSGASYWLKAIPPSYEEEWMTSILITPSVAFYWDKSESLGRVSRGHTMGMWSDTAGRSRLWDSFVKCWRDKHRAQAQMSSWNMDLSKGICGMFI